MNSKEHDKRHITCSFGSAEDTNLRFEVEILSGDPKENLRALIEELTPEGKNEVFHRVWHLADRPLDGDAQWGEHHAFDDLPRLYKAYNSLDFPEDFQNYNPPSAG